MLAMRARTNPKWGLAVIRAWLLVTSPHRPVPGRPPEDVHHIALAQLGARELTHELAVHLPARDLDDPEPPHLGALFTFE
jgi:hypothetical protein